MYNAERKERYINYVENVLGTVTSPGYLKTKFNNSEPYEEKLGKDLCDFSFYEITDMYSMFNLRSLESYVVLNSIYSLYTDWCLREGLVQDQINHFKTEVKIANMEKCVNAGFIKKKVITREALLKCCNEVKNPADAYVLLGLFEGISGDCYSDLIDLKLSDITEDESGYIAHLPSGRVVPVSKEFYNYARNANEDLEYTSYSETERVIQMEETGAILKRNKRTKLYDKEANGKRIYFQIKKSLAYVGLEFMLGNSVYESGRVAFVKSRAAYYRLNVEDYLRSHGDEVAKRYPPKIQVDKFIRKYKEVLG